MPAGRGHQKLRQNRAGQGPRFRVRREPDGGLPLLGSGPALAGPALQCCFVGRLRVALSTLGIGVEALGARAQRLDESCILVPATQALPNHVPMPVFTCIGTRGYEIDVL
jgi:hypothetical protein